MKSGRLWMLVAIILAGSVSVLAQVSPSTENGVKSFGSYQAGDFDTVNLQTGNVMFHVPLFSYPQRGKLPWRFVLTGSSKNWQVGEWVDQQQISHLKWILGEPAGVYVREPDGLEFHRNRFIATDFTGNQTETDGNYSLISSDGAVHWLSGMTPNGNMITQDGSGIQFTLIRGTQWDHSDDSGVIIERDGTQTVLPSISLPIPVGGQGNNLIGMFFP